MSHDHKHHHDTSKNIAIAFFLNLIFAIIELIGGFLTNSVAIISDALHDLGDTMSLGFGWWMQRISGRQVTQAFSYGYQRFSLLGALINTLILLIGSLLILSESIPRLWSPESVDAPGMLVLSVFGIAINGFAAYKTSRGDSHNERTISLHLLEDVLGWIAILIVSVILLFVDLPILDPILSILIALYILYRAFHGLVVTARIFLQATPDHLSPERIRASLIDHQYVSDIHDIHVWSLDGERHILSAHIVVKSSTTISQIITLKSELKSLLSDMGIGHATLEIEYAGEECEESC